jgi:3-dehydroquinate synthase
MLESFEILSSSGTYRVNVGEDLLSTRLHCNTTDVCIVDGRLSNLIAGKELISIPIVASEEAKSLDALSPVIERMRRGGAGRSSRIIAIGGGVIQDIATLVASLYMRGVVWEYFPTTLLAMVDSCIGGKSSINVYDFKNLIGNIYPPEQINIDINFLKTLNNVQIVDGLCEAVKICYAKSLEDFEEYLNKASAMMHDLVHVAGVIALCLKTKKWFIEIDEFDRKERLLLNFGHTFGHALESATQFQISHGVAVGIGMIVASEYSAQQELLTDNGSKRALRLMAYVAGLIAPLPNLVNQLKTIDYRLVIEKFANDKKHKTHHYRIIVPQGDGGVHLLDIPRTEKCHMNILAAYRAAANRLANRR